MERLVSVFGIACFIALAWCLSSNRSRFPWRTVITGLALQVLLALFILRTQTGADLFGFLDLMFSSLLDYAKAGTSMVFGPMANATVLESGLGKGNGFIFAITVTGTIILVSALSSALYHYGILQLVVRGVAAVMQRVMGLSGSESLAAAANIFMGQTEAPLVIKPYLLTMTRSELMAVMVGGMATIAGGVLAAYVAMDISAGHLLTASVMSAPAALLMSKVLMPETESSSTAAGASAEIKRETSNGLEAICNGASDGIKLSINIMAMLIAFVAIVALVNGLLANALSWVGVSQAQPLQWALGYLNAPFAWLMGVPTDECLRVGAILGERVVLNEFMGYLSLSQAAGELDPRTTMITTFALCGFANFSSIAIQIGGIGALVPERRADLAQLGLKSMIGGLLACYTTAAIAALVVS
jgi:concentrative nucleoside transporter, CNT family